MIEINIEKLFGHFDYHFCIEENGITILTGPNGFGKSTIIHCIHAIGDSDLSFFFEIKYDKIEISIQNQRKKLTIIAKDDRVLFNGREITKRSIQYFRRGVVPVRSAGSGENVEFNAERESYKEILSTMKGIFSDAFFISEHRVVKNAVDRVVRYADKRRIEREWMESIQEIPRKLEEHMQEAEGNYTQKANELDSTFPERLFAQKDGISKEDFHTNLKLMHERVQKLQNNGFTQLRELRDMEFQSEDARALKVYFDDFSIKYQEFEGILNKLELFQDIVGRRFQFKQMKISNMNGMKVIDEVSGKPIPLSRLSSGEKEILVLFYNLLFENTDGGILLVDEPEMSLHIVWQRMFIDDLKKIAALRNLTVIIATHSPQIINGNRNIQIDLGELYKDGLNKTK